MAVNVVFMGSLIELTMARTITVEDQESVHSLYRYLEERFPDLKTKSFRILINDEVINSERKLEAGDEVLLLPPHDGT